MKRKISVLLVICMIAVCCFAGCAPKDEGQATPTPLVATPTATASMIPTPTATPAPTEDGTEKAAADVYTIAFDVSIIQGAAGFVFNGLGDEFLMWQLNYGEIATDKLYFRPHLWSGGGACLEDIPVAETVATGTPDEEMHMEIRMDKGNCETYLNGTLIYTYEAEFYEYDDYCGIGFRTDAIQASERLECASFDNIVVTNSLGEVVMQEDFEGETNFFSEIIEDNAYDCEVQDGKLVVGQTQKVLLMEYLPPLNP